MRFVPTRVHGVADWLMGALLVALPWLVGLDRAGPEGWLPMALGGRRSRTAADVVRLCSEPARAPRGAARVVPPLYEEVLMHWIFLGIASVFEVVFALSANASKGFTHRWYSIQTFAAAAVAIYFLSLSLKVLDVGVGYAIWTAIGAVGTVIFGVVLFNEKLNAGKVISIIAVVAGVVALKAVSGV